MASVVEWARVARDWGAFVGPCVAWGGSSCLVSPLTKSRGIAAWLMNRWARDACAVLGIDVALQHAERLDHGRQKVMVANHDSLLDIPIIGSQLTHDYRWVAKRQVFGAPFIGWHMWLTGHVPVSRGGADSRDELERRFRGVVLDGADLLFFPEGTRSPDGSLRPFKLGAFLAAVDHGLPVQPLVVTGSSTLLRKGRLYLEREKGHRCFVSVLPLLEPPTEGSRRERAEALRDATHAAVRAALAEAREGA